MTFPANPVSKKVFFFLLGAFLFSIFVFQFSHAAQDTTVVEDNAPIYIDPKEESEILEYLPIGHEVRISSYPLPGGWYKVRSKTGIYGWVHEKYLSTTKPKEGVSPEVAATQVKPERDRRFYLRGLGGFDFFRPDDLNDIYGFQDLNTGYYAGGELGWFLAQRVVVAIRSEVIWKDIVAKEKNLGVAYNLSIRSYPVMMGFDFYFAKLPSARLSVGIFAGAALATTFTSEAFNMPKPNTVSLDANPFTALARINLTRPLGRVFSVFAEGGYRFLRTTEISTVNSIQGGEVFIKNGYYVPRIIDLSGPFVGVGLGLHL